GWLAGYLNYLQRQGGEMSAFRIQGGAERLFSAMQVHLNAEPELGRRLVRVSQEGAKVLLEFENDSAVVDAAVLTVPPKCLERVVFDPALPTEKRCAIEASRMSPIIKICWEFSEA